jgi:hypothetical protein
MTNSTRVIRESRQALPPAAQTVAAIIVTAVLVLLAAGCSGGSPSLPGSGGSPNAGGSSRSSSTVDYSQCMRSHGVPNFPDPNGSGEIPKETAQQLGVSSSQYQTAQTACAHLLPNSGGVSQAEIAQMMGGMRGFAQCMRSHGVSNWPDPSTDRAGYPIFYLQNRIDENSPQIMTTIRTCQPLLPQSGSLSIPGGVAMCPGDRPGPDVTSACGGPHQGGSG